MPSTADRNPESVWLIVAGKLLPIAIQTHEPPRILLHAISTDSITADFGHGLQFILSDKSNRVVQHPIELQDKTLPTEPTKEKG